MTIALLLLGILLLHEHLMLLLLLLYIHLLLLLLLYIHLLLLVLSGIGLLLCDKLLLVHRLLLGGIHMLVLLKRCSCRLGAVRIHWLLVVCACSGHGCAWWWISSCCSIDVPCCWTVRGGTLAGLV